MNRSIRAQLCRAAFCAGLCATAAAQSVTFNSASVSIGNADDAPDCLAVADFNGDGLLDLASANYGLRWGTPGEPGGWNNSLTLLRNTGNGQFAFEAKITVGRGPRGVVAADLDADGKADMAVVNETDDLVVVNWGNGTLSVLLNNGSGGYDGQTLPVPSYPSSVAVADLNGDGTQDLACASTGAHLVQIYLNDGNGGFTTAGTVATGRIPNVCAGDLNSDGKPDLACPSFQDGTVTVLRNQTTFPSAGPPPALSIATVGNRVRLSWPSSSSAWSLQDCTNLTGAPWTPSGHHGWVIGDDGTSKSLTVPRTDPRNFFRLMHP